MFYRTNAEQENLFAANFTQAQFMYNYQLVRTSGENVKATVAIRQ